MIKKPNFITHLSKMSRTRSEFLSDEPVEGDIPVSPVGTVNAHIVGLINNWGALRYMFLIPWLLAMCVACGYMVNDFFKAWRASERDSISFIESRKKSRGEDYFQVTDNEVALSMYREIDESGNMPLEAFLDQYYRQDTHAKYQLQADIVFSIFYLIAIPGLLISIIRFHRRAQLYFDRDRRIVYTWRFGHVWAQHYDDVWYYTNNMAMTFILYGFDKKGRFKPRLYVVTPNGGPFMNGDVLYRPVLGFVAKFMEQGRDAVWSSDWTGRRGFYFYEDKRPDDFDAQLARVLNHIRDQNVNAEVDRLVASWNLEAQGR